MSEETLIRHCAPTLAGIKTGNLFRCAYPDQREMIEDVRRWNTALSPKGLRRVVYTCSDMVASFSDGCAISVVSRSVVKVCPSVSLGFSPAPVLLHPAKRQKAIHSDTMLKKTFLIRPSPYAFLS